ncbi:MAG: RIP metalloprotease RseP [Cyclobacteriaceae bacterium]|nr:RIP metalloprotease RseP [Cyclobacteriaceae bacterium]
MDVLVMAAQMILGLSILVGLHELGHLLAAKIFGMRVEQYSIGFPPRIFKFKYGETVYSIGAIPLGGYVKIAGMIDESLDVKSMSEEPKPWEFRAKPAWQRLIVMIGGILVNVITGIVIFIIMAYSMGDTYIPKEEANKYGIYAHDLAREIGLQTGDKILEVNGHDYQSFSDLTSPNALLEDEAYYTVERNGNILEVSLPGNFIEQLSPSRKNKNPEFIDPIFKFRIGEVVKGTGAASGGLQEGDRILSISGIPINFYYEFKTVVDTLEDQTVPVVVERDERTLDLQIPVASDGTMGFYPDPQINYATVQYNFGESIPKGIDKAFGIVFVNIKAFGKIFSGDLDFSKSVSGPIGIAKTFGGQWDWLRFWNLVGLLSMILAFMNFLPIPALDGGHVMFLTYEIVSGQKPSDKFMEAAQKVGMVLLLSLMVFIIFNDIFKEVF